MAQRSLPGSIFVLANRWLVTSVALFCLGCIGIAMSAWLAPATPTPVAAVSRTIQSTPSPIIPTQQVALALDLPWLPAASGLCFFLSVICFLMWAYNLAKCHNLLPALNSMSINQLATKKLITVLGVSAGCGLLMYWSMFTVALATPFFSNVSST